MFPSNKGHRYLCNIKYTDMVVTFFMLEIDKGTRNEGSR